jgi:hypothetical protein
MNEIKGHGEITDPDLVTNGFRSYLSFGRLRVRVGTLLTRRSGAKLSCGPTLDRARCRRLLALHGLPCIGT